MADPSRQEKAHKEASPELPELDEEEIESYIISKPDLSRTSKKQNPKKLYKKAQKQAEVAESNYYIPETPKKSRSKGGKMKSDQQDVLTPGSTLDEMSPSQDGDGDEADAQPETPHKRVGRLGYGGRQWAKGYASPGNGW
ncbi:Hypothetical predicted protein [Lecanosticta acicola]|uniref:Uncharacterized protein n=1 Tax=Lecanosticta acicola TaxID=111012 RepID=A0AAI9E8L1_9PEZI|nr:Hypothetical predicted protein [Lecanosticta acicola]